MTTINDNDLVLVLLDGSWIDQTRERVAVEFECGVCLDFGQLDGIGPCPACDPDGYAEHVSEVANGPRFGMHGDDPWAPSTTREAGHVR